MLDNSWINPIEQEIILPSQFAERGRARTPEQRLMWAVLSDALDLLLAPLRPVALKATSRPRAIAEARAWVASDDTLWPFSFENICGALGLHPDWLRRRVLALHKQVQAGERVKGVPTRVLHHGGQETRGTTERAA